MTVIPSTHDPLDEAQNAVKLADYARYAGYEECALMGVNDGGDSGSGCNPIWSWAMRSTFTHFLGEAQEEIEHVVGYPLSPKYFESEQHKLLPSQRLTLWNKKLLAMGVRAVTTIQAGASVNHATDPAVIGPIATTVTDEDEIHVFHPGTEIEIIPSQITIAGGNVTIAIPRCRLVVDQDNDETGWNYNDVPPLTVFEATVDVARVYTDNATQGVLVYPHRTAGAICDCACGCSCGEQTETACVYIRNAENGLVDAQRADYAAGTWTPFCSSCFCHGAEYVRISYLAGTPTLSKQAKDAIIRLAHAKMPHEPCGCGQILNLWKRDTEVPGVLDTERLNCPFGLSNGAWIAWKFANALRPMVGGAI